MTDVYVRRLFFPPVVESDEAATNGTDNETQEKKAEADTDAKDKEMDDTTKDIEDKAKDTSTNGGKQDDSGDESWEEVEMEKSELELEAEAEEIAQKLPDPPTSDPAEVEEEKKKKGE